LWLIGLISIIGIMDMAFKSGWRYCKNCAVLFDSSNSGSLGLCAIGGGAPHDPSASGKYGLFCDEPGLPGQDNWRECNNCKGVYFPATPGHYPTAAKPDCPYKPPAGMTFNGQHVANGSKNYTMATIQTGWLYCYKCQALFYPGSGTCVAGGHHESRGIASYEIPLGPSGAAGESVQPGWRFCSRCRVLFFPGSGSGFCVNQQPHDPSGSGNYALRILWDPPASWKYCTQCHALFHPNASAPAGRKCPAPAADATGQHTPEGSYNIQTVQSGWKYCGKCQAMWFSGSPAQGKCPTDNGAHNGDTPIKSRIYTIPVSDVG
jgi:hypothetical protein